MNIAVFVNSLKYIDDNFSIIVSLSVWVNTRLGDHNSKLSKIKSMILNEDFEIFDCLEYRLSGHSYHSNELIATEQSMLSLVRFMIYIKDRPVFRHAMTIACCKRYTKVIDLLLTCSVELARIDRMLLSD